MRSYLEKDNFLFQKRLSRNENLLKLGFKPPIMRSTGTTICGVIFKDGVILGADNKATKGPIVDNKICEKIYYIQDNI